MESMRHANDLSDNFKFVYAGTIQDILQELILKLEFIKLLLQYTNVFNRIAHFYS